MNLEQEINTLTAEIREMVGMARSVKGEPFANYATALFHLASLAAIGHSLTRDLDPQPALVVRKKIEEHSIALGSHLAAGFDQQDRDEAFNLATRMFERQVMLQAKIRARSA